MAWKVRFAGWPPVALTLAGMAPLKMDIQMPVLDGYQTTQAIRSSTHPQAQTIPIISLSADAFTEDIRRAYASGMNDHVSKPIVPEELFAAITRVLKTLN